MRILLLFSLFLFGCTTSSTSSKPLVLVSIPPYEYFVGAIAKDLVEVTSIVPPGVNSHAFEPTPKSIKEASKAFIWFQIGEAFEPKLTGVIAEKNPAIRFVNVQKGVPLIHSGCTHSHCEHAKKDIHSWLDPTLAMIQAENILSALVEAFPEKKNYLENNFQQLKLSLKELDNEIFNQLGDIPRRTIITNHSSLIYFTERYSLEEKSISLEGKEFLPQSLIPLTKNIEDIAVVISLPQFPNKGVKIFAKRYSLPLKIVDPLAKNYPAMMKRLTKSIRQGATR